MNNKLVELPNLNNEHFNNLYLTARELKDFPAGVLHHVIAAEGQDLVFFSGSLHTAWLAPQGN